jgi:hypothetical protein
MWWLLASYAWASTWTVYRGAGAPGSPGAPFHCFGDEVPADEFAPYCPDLLNTSLAVDDQGNYLFVLERGPMRRLGPAGGPIDMEHAVVYRYFDATLGDYPVANPRELVVGSFLRPGSPRPEGHSPSVAFVPTGEGVYFAISSRFVSPLGGFLHQEVALADPGAATPPVPSFRPTDPSGRLCGG